MKSPIKYYILLSGLVASFWGCSNSDDVGDETARYNLTVLATKDSGEIETRALLLGGNTGTRFCTIWDSGDKAEVYKDGVHVGTLYPNTIGQLKTELSGTLTGSFSVGDYLDVYVPETTMDFDNQKGTLGDVSSKHSFVYQSARVTGVSGSTITIEELEFVSRQCYLRFQFMDEDGVRLHVEQLKIEAASGKLVLTKTKEGVTTYGDLVINLEKVNGEYPSEIYVALHNDLGAKDVYNFTVKAGGYIYYSTESAAKINANLVDDKAYYAFKTLTLQGSATRLDSQVGSAIESHADGGGDSNGSVNF